MHKIPAGEYRKHLLMIHTENGQMIKEKNILRSLRSWIKEIDEELNISVMDVRAAYASFMIQKYVRERDNGGDAFNGLDKDSFLQMIGDIMNTSKEQLINVYMASAEEGFSKTVARLMGIVDKEEGQGENEKERKDLMEMVQDSGEEDI